MQLYSLYIKPNRTGSTNFSNISHTSHILGLSYLCNFFESYFLANIRTADIRRDPQRPQATGSVSPSLTEVGNISTYPGHQLKMNKPDTRKHFTEFSYKNTCFSLVLLIQSFSQDMEKSQVLVKI